MIELQLIHVGTTEALAVRLLEGASMPEWFTDESDNGTLNVRQWRDNHIMIDLTANCVGQEHAVRVTVSGLYATAEHDYFDQPEDEQDALAREKMDELMPFLRQAVYNASSQVWPIKPILIDARAGMTKAGDRREHTDEG